ncbi:hypothetical protein [Ornithinibacillus bavariensis]|uniref:DUF7847 domain-containing protein n=1 Tax=Ornithinibacillus bavariensis TaxID=545502 RepID=A0A919X8Y9_9BACI|nr:hypothetical protein [Ornithinibacillus bavariensis]GIO26715.1 hypothetical protein J43TS3_13260 [Ornithinibacillus bavariensis]
MNEHFTRPMRFGEVLDQTFRLSKNNFSSFLLIMLILIGPTILLEALILLLTGTGFFRDMASGGSFLEQYYNTILDVAYEPTTIGEDIGTIIMGLASIVLYPMAQAAIILVIDASRRQEEFAVGSAIKRAFSRFWPIFGSSLLMGLIIFGMFFVAIIVISIFTAIGVVFHPIIGIAMGVVLFLVIGGAIAYFLTRWGLYLPAVVFEHCAPGLGRSWSLTRRNFWRTFGLFVVLGLIIVVISSVFELLFFSFLGTSVVYNILLSIVNLITTMFFAVGYAIIYFDLKLRNDGDDLIDMMENYENPKN